VIIVSGCPRSGTSMMMRIMEKVYGKDRILGRILPEPEEKERTEIHQYIFEKIHKDSIEKMKKRKDRAKDMNPNGYHEMEFCVKGVSYHPAFEDTLNELLMDPEPKICKIVSLGLAMSDPKFITKVVMMVRDPKAVAKSQERLGRNNPMDPEDAPERDGEKVLIRSVAMFNASAISVAGWLSKHSDIPVHIVNYDDLLDDPEPVLSSLGEFLEQDFSSAYDMIDKTLRRSKPEEVEGDNVEFAMKLYEQLKVGNWDGINKVVEAKIQYLKENPPKSKNFYCTRLNQRINVEVCKLCKTHPRTLFNLRQNAEKRKINWRDEPCVYECIEGKTVEESIQDNHWLASMQ